MQHVLSPGVLLHIAYCAESSNALLFLCSSVNFKQMACIHAPASNITAVRVHYMCDVVTACASQMATQFNVKGCNVKYMQVGDSDIPSIGNHQIPSPHHAQPAGTPRAAEDETVVLSVLPHQDQWIYMLCVYAYVPACICLYICHHFISLVCKSCHICILQTTVVDNTCCQLLACTCKSRQMILHCRADLLI